MSEWKAWTKEEDDLLREVWKMEGALKWHMDKFPGRTVNAIRFRGHRELGLPHRTALRATKYSWVQEVVDKAFDEGFVGTVHELADATKASHQRCRELIKRGHGTKFYICDWKRRTNGCDWTPVWAPGTEQDAPKPAAKSSAEVSVKYRQNKKVKEGRLNPFATAIANVTGVEVISTKGQYKSRVYKEAELETA